MGSLKIILGDISYPKSESLVIPANLTGVMKGRINNKIIKAGWRGIEKEAKEIVNKNKFKIGDFFITGPGRLKRRGVKNIYHAIIKRLPSDFTSLTIVSSTLNKVLKNVIKDKMKSVTICALGIESGGLDTYSVAMITVELCKKFMTEIEIKIIDDNKNFINDVKDILDKK